MPCPGLCSTAVEEKLVKMSRVSGHALMHGFLIVLCRMVECSAEGLSPLCPVAHRFWGDPESGRVNEHMSHIPEESPCKPS